MWAQDQRYKLYRDGTLYAVRDRHEAQPLPPGHSEAADAARSMLQAALETMPTRAEKLQPPTRRR